MSSTSGFAVSRAVNGGPGGFNENATWHVDAPDPKATQKPAEVVDPCVNRDIPVPGDYTNDKMNDYVVFRPWTNEWRIKVRGTNAEEVHQGA